ncbi:unnamed protein product [Didymodactylos carnosus]|nr:unnamed protein product [Didymodactylos carnosus]CAF4429204.1 unnamed protein product [Didymodactylos carnosus]
MVPSRRFILMLLFYSVNASHFHGGIVTYKPVNNTITTAACGGYTPIHYNEYCTDFSVALGSISGSVSTISTLATNSSFTVQYADQSWITLAIGGSTAYWSITCHINLVVRPDGIINTAPSATIISHADGLSILAHMMNAGRDVCHAVPSTALLIQDICTLIFNSTGTTVGSYYAVALQLEDFWNSTTISTAMSSIPIQFLVKIFSPPSNGCTLTPTLTANVSACTAIIVDVPFSFQVNANIGCGGTTIQDIFRTPPLYMYKTTLTQTSPTVWTLQENWTPQQYSSPGATTTTSAPITNAVVTSVAATTTTNTPTTNDVTTTAITTTQYTTETVGTT